MAAVATQIAHVGQTVTLRAIMGINITALTSRSIRFRSPVSSGTFTGVSLVDATTGTFDYITTTSDLDTSGSWIMQGQASSVSSVAIGQWVTVLVRGVVGP